MLVKKIFISILLLSWGSLIFAQMSPGDEALINIRENYRMFPGHSYLNGYFFNTSAVGGVPDFTTDLNFEKSSLVQFNQFGSFGFFDNGLQAAIKTNKYRILTTYSYLNNNGFRQHSNEYWHIVNIAVQTKPGINSELTVLGYYIKGQLKLPGSLTKTEFEKDPYLADQRSINRDEKKVGTKGRVDVVYKTRFGNSLNNEVEVTGYGKIESYVRSTREYKIVNKYGLGLTAMYSNTSRFGRFTNTFSVGGDLFTQPERTEEYENFGGEKSDQMEQLKNEKSGRIGFFCSDNFEIINKKLFVLATCRYENLTYQLTEETLPSRYDKKIFQGFSPEVAITYQFKPWIALNASYGSGFNPPDDNQLDSPYPAYLYNQDLVPQKSRTFELGLKSDIPGRDSAKFCKSIHFEATFFNTNIENEIVSYEVYGDYFFRNAAKSHRLGIELGSRLEIIRDLKFEFTYTFAHCIYNSYTAQSLEVDSTGNLVDVDRDFAGNRGPNIPTNNIFLSLSYEYPVMKKMNIFAELRYLGTSGLWVDDANSDKTNASNVLDGLLGFDLKFEKFNIVASGGINNMFDKVYSGYVTCNSADQRFYNAGAPRNYFLSINFGYTF